MFGGQRADATAKTRDEPAYGAPLIISTNEVVPQRLCRFFWLRVSCGGELTKMFSPQRPSAGIIVWGTAESTLNYVLGEGKRRLCFIWLCLSIPLLKTQFTGNQK